MATPQKDVIDAANALVDALKAQGWDLVTWSADIHYPAYPAATLDFRLGASLFRGVRPCGVKHDVRGRTYGKGRA